MLRGQLRIQGQSASTGATEGRAQHMVVFSVAGYRLAARSEEISGIMRWPGAIPVPSETPFVAALVRLEEGCLPVFDLASKFQRMMREGESLCLVVKHVDGPLAVCIDAEVPSLQMVPRSSVQYRLGDDPDIAGSCMAGGEQLPIINLATLGVSSSRCAG
ncbi:MAG: chemotaxis protein CheW [Nitrospira sp.]|nr:chemotaxis protein CheW [Nitrospira sp.]